MQVVCIALQELTSLQHVVEVRENKLLQLSKDNVDLQETTNILRRFVKTQCEVYKLSVKCGSFHVSAQKLMTMIRCVSENNNFINISL